MAQDREGRIPLPSPEDMSEAQYRVYQSVVSGPRGVVIGPLRAAIHSPLLAEKWSQLGEVLRYGCSLPKRITELAILVTGRRWTSQIEWWVHAKAALAAGIPPDAIEAIRLGQSPSLHREDWESYEFARQLQQTGQVEIDLYRAITTRWGAQGIVELAAVIGYYTMVSMTLNVHEIPLPEGVAPPLAAICGSENPLPELPAAKLEV